MNPRLFEYKPFFFDDISHFSVFTFSLFAMFSELSQHSQLRQFFFLFQGFHILHFMSLPPQRQTQLQVLLMMHPRNLQCWWVLFLLYSCIYLIDICHHHHHHHVVPPARISLTLSRHFSLSFISSERSSELHPVSSQSCFMYVQAGRSAFARPYVGIHRCTSLMSSSLLLQQCPVCLVRLTWIVFVMIGRWPYSWCFFGCCLQDLFNIARSILV